MEFFRDILQKRDSFFDMPTTKMNMSLEPNQQEALNLVFYAIYQGKDFSEIQRLYDDGLLSTNTGWLEWLFAVKSKLNQVEDNNLFGANDTTQSIVNERLYSIILNDGMSNIYKTPTGKPIIERYVNIFVFLFVYNK